MKKYLHALYRSFYDAAMYRQVLTEWRGFGGLYALTISFFTATFLILFVAYTAAQFKMHTLPLIADKIPEITVDGGQVLLKKQDEKPIEMHLSLGKIIIDTNRSPDDFKKEKNLVFGLGKDFTIFKTTRGLETNPIPPDSKFIINRATFETFSPEMGAKLLLFAFPFLIAGQTLMFLVKMVFMAIISYMVTAFTREEYDFEARLRMSALALTPPVLISLLLTIFLRHETALWFSFLVGALYFYVMILLMRRPSNVKAA